MKAGNPSRDSLAETNWQIQGMRLLSLDEVDAKDIYLLRSTCLLGGYIRPTLTMDPTYKLILFLRCCFSAILFYPFSKLKAFSSCLSFLLVQTGEVLENSGSLSAVGVFVSKKRIGTNGGW
jgi:hypothetical protein